MFSLESSHRGDSNVHTQYTILIIKKKITPDYSKSAAMVFFYWGLKNEVEIAVVNEPSVFEPLKFYCILRSNRFNPNKRPCFNYRPRNISENIIILTCMNSCLLLWVR